MKLRVHPAFFLYVLLIGLIDGWISILCILITLFIHESGHLLVGKLFKEEYESLEITPLGGMISYKAGCSSCKGLKGACVAAAGPTMSIGAVYLLCSTPTHKALTRDTAEMLICMNTSMFLLNMLPVLPLDGGRCVFSIGYCLFPVAQLIGLLTALGRVTGIALSALSIYGFLHFGRMNLSLLAAGVYIFFCAVKQHEVLYAGSLHTAIQERLAKDHLTQNIQTVCVREHTRLSSIIPLLCRSEKCVFAVERGSSLQFIAEKQVLNELLSDPTRTFSETFPE